MRKISLEYEAQKILEEGVKRIKEATSVTLEELTEVEKKAREVGNGRVPLADNHT